MMIWRCYVKTVSATWPDDQFDQPTTRFGGFFYCLFFVTGAKFCSIDEYFFMSVLLIFE